MEYILLFPVMIFLHIIDDFHLQGILASMKQKSWWIDQIESMSAKLTKKSKEEYLNKYKYDWIPCLIAHAFQWSSIVMLPLLIYSWEFRDSFGGFYLILMTINSAIHAFIDHLKCNSLVINLVTDQIVHLLQIVITWLIWGIATNS